MTIEHTPSLKVPSNGIELCCDSFGRRADPPIVLIMGLASQMIAWDEGLCTLLAERGFWVLRFDNRDVGESTILDGLGVPDVMRMFQAQMQGQPVTAPYTLSDMARDTVGLMDAMDIGRAHVVGASMGGAIAQTLAIEHPGRLLSLTSIMATSGDPSLPPPKPEALQILFTPTPTDREGYYRRYVQTWKVLRAGSFPEDEARDLERAAMNFNRGLHPAGTARQLVAILASGSRKPALPGVRVPTLVIHGKADPLVPVECGIDVADAIPGAQRLIIEDMGHALPQRHWPRMTEAIAAHAARSAPA